MSAPTLALTPSGQVVFLPEGDDGPPFPPEIADRIRQAFHEHSAASGPDRGEAEKGKKIGVGPRSRARQEKGPTAG